MDIFQQLGRQIEKKWRGVDYDEAQLPSLAAEALKQADIPSKTNVWDIVEWALGEDELPRQRDVGGKFGDPPLTVYSGPRFHIDVYFWFEGTTSIHQHAFCGAFQVMQGSSIHSWYGFDCEERINSFTEVGSMTLRKCELLSIGDVQEILPGRAYIHSLFHLDHPSVTIVVRTDRSPLELPQYNYYKPSLAVDPYFEQETVTKKTQLAAALIRARHPEADRIIGEWLAECDLQTAFGLLSNLRHVLRGSGIDQLFKLDGSADRFQMFLNMTEEHQGIKTEVLRAVFDRQDTIDVIVERRGLVNDPELRFFLALLLNVEGREAIFSLIRQRCPDAEPLEKVLDWVQDLANTRIVGYENANALGIPDFGDVDIFVLEQMLQGMTGRDIEDAMRSQYGESAIETGTVIDKEGRIRDAAIFRALFS